MTSNPTSLLNALFALTDSADAIRYVEQDGEALLFLGSVHLALSLSSQEALDKLAVAAAQAAAERRAQNLRAVA